MSVAALLLAGSTMSCDLAGVANDKTDEDADNTSNGEPKAGTYVIRGGVRKDQSAIVRPLDESLAGNSVRQAQGGCPFADVPESPCNDSACRMGPDTDACAEVVATYCASHPEDAGCSHGPDGGSGGPDGGSGGPDGGSGGPDGGSGGPDGGPPMPLETYTPTSFWMKVYKVQFSRDAQGCTDPITVGEVANPEYQDFTQSPVLVTADPPPPATYPCIIVTMSDHIEWLVEDDGMCSGERRTQDVHNRYSGGQDDVEETITVYMSTRGQGNESGPVDAFSAPGILLAEPHVAGDDVASSTFYVDVTDVVELRNESDSLVCDMQPPLFGFSTTVR